MYLHPVASIQSHSSYPQAGNIMFLDHLSDLSATTFSLVINGVYTRHMVQPWAQHSGCLSCWNFSGHVGCPFSSPALTLARSFGCCTSSSMLISTFSAVISRPFSQSCQKQLLWQCRVTGFCVCSRISICIVEDPKTKQKKKYSLRVEHAWTNNKLEDILEGFEGSEYGLTLFSSTGHI